VDILRRSVVSQDLVISTGFGTEEPIQSNELPICIHCGEPITEVNDSGWEAFTEDGRTTQKICISCDKKNNIEGKKEDCP
jgi:hypothetical protein